MEKQIRQAYQQKRDFFATGATRSYAFRLDQLQRLETMLSRHEAEWVAALYADLGKPYFEAYTAEIALVHEEIQLAKQNLRQWMAPRQVPTPLILEPASSWIHEVPLGVVLIIGPWNYPLQLLLLPLVGALAAGNCAVLKPSEEAGHTAALLARLVGEYFGEDCVSVIQGAGAVVGPLLLATERFDHVFFTGSAPVGRQLAVQAARQLIPVTLELGGKSPVIVDRNVPLAVTARRIAWAKFFNAGQTCVSPDYVLVHAAVREELVAQLKHCIREFFGPEPAASESYGRIINEKRFDVLCGYLQEGRILAGGQHERRTRYLAPTLLDSIPAGAAVMQEEIFGPILPVIEVAELAEAAAFVQRRPQPLALYLFTDDAELERRFIDGVDFGGGCVNNCMLHLLNPHLPFGGVGLSGLGRYRGHHTFALFSHQKAVVKSGLRFDPPLRYPPYGEGKTAWVKRLFRWGR